MSRIGKNPVTVPSGVDGRARRPEGHGQGQARRACRCAVARRSRPRSRTARSWVKPRERDQAGAHDVGHDAHLVHNMVTGVATGLHQVNLEINGVGYRAAVQGKNLHAAARLQPRRHLPDPGGHQDQLRASRPRSRSPAPTSSRSARSRPRSARYRKPEPYKGKGIKYRRREDPPQGRQEEVGAEPWHMPEDLFDRRRQRVALPAPAQVAAAGRGCRCSARRSTSMPRSSTTRRA